MFFLCSSHVEHVSLNLYMSCPNGSGRVYPNFLLPPIVGRIPLASFETIHLAQLAWAVAKARDTGKAASTFVAPSQQLPMPTQLPDVSTNISTGSGSNASVGGSNGVAMNASKGGSMFADLQLLKRIAQALAGRVASMGPSELCMVAWAMAVSASNICQARCCT